VLTEYRGEFCHFLIALHAVRSAASVERFVRDHPGRTAVVTITGTDIYAEAPSLESARRTAGLAARVVFLREPSPDELGRLFGASDTPNYRVIYQSAEPPMVRREPRTDVFEVCVLGHLRPVKDPFRTAAAARLLPPESRVRVLQVGKALDPQMEAAAKAEAASNLRYRWYGELPRADALHLLSGCRLLALTSVSEGGPSAVSEALACGVPVVSSRIDGVIGLLGPDYPGYFPAGDTAALAVLLRRCESDQVFYRRLADCCDDRRPLIDPARERAAWRELLAELSRGEATD
jgi:putative glycosyltransferase (TIGR04348 family)